MKREKHFREEYKELYKIDGLTICESITDKHYQDYLLVDPAHNVYATTLDWEMVDDYCRQVWGVTVYNPREIAKKNRTILTPLDTLGLSARTINPLRSAGIDYLEDVSQLTEQEFIHLEGFGKKGWNELLPVLSERRILFLSQGKKENTNIANVQMTSGLREKLLQYSVSLPSKLYTTAKITHISILGRFKESAYRRGILDQLDITPRRGPRAASADEGIGYPIYV